MYRFIFNVDSYSSIHLYECNSKHTAYENMVDWFIEEVSCTAEQFGSCYYVMFRTLLLEICHLLYPLERILGGVPLKEALDGIYLKGVSPF
jgi:hypothetical protein